MRIPLFTLTLILTSAPVPGSNTLDQYFSFRGFQLEKTELSEIQKVLDDAHKHREGDVGTSYAAICYQVPKDNITIYFESGEMGGVKYFDDYNREGLGPAGAPGAGGDH